MSILVLRSPRGRTPAGNKRKKFGGAGRSPLLSRESLAVDAPSQAERAGLEGSMRRLRTRRAYVGSWRLLRPLRQSPGTPEIVRPDVLHAQKRGPRPPTRASSGTKKLSRPTHAVVGDQAVDRRVGGIGSGVHSYFGM